jgi:hypothetical protein
MGKQEARENTLGALNKHFLQACILCFIIQMRLKRNCVKSSISTIVQSTFDTFFPAD